MKPIITAFLFASLSAFAAEPAKQLYEITTITSRAGAPTGVNWDKIIGPVSSTPIATIPAAAEIRYIDNETLDEVLALTKESPDILCSKLIAADGAWVTAVKTLHIPAGDSSISLKQGESTQVASVNGKTKVTLLRYSFKGTSQLQDELSFHVDIPAGKIAVIRLPVEWVTTTVPNPSFWSWLPWNPSTVEQTVQQQTVIFVTRE